VKTRSTGLRGLMKVYDATVSTVGLFALGSANGNWVFPNYLCHETEVR